MPGCPQLSVLVSASATIWLSTSRSISRVEDGPGDWREQHCHPVTFPSCSEVFPAIRFKGDWHGNRLFFEADFTSNDGRTLDLREAQSV